MANNDKNNYQQTATAQEKIDSSNNVADQYKISGNNPVHVNQGAVGYSMSDDILSGATFKKYKHTEKLEGSQMQYSAGNGMKKIINFKQDYVVIIRKKLFYAANSQSQMTTADGKFIDGEIGDGRYVRSYRVDNFTGIRTSHSVHGSIASCSIEMKGNERVFCYEENPLDPLSGKQSVFGTDLSSATSNLNPVNPNEADTPQADEAGNLEIVNNFQAQGSSFWNQKEKTTSTGSTYSTELKDGEANGTVYVTTAEGGQYTMTLPATAKEGMVDSFAGVYGVSNMGGNPDAGSVGWKIAEKCDWEPMDEVWVFGKSNFERSHSGDFKMIQIYFGYIDSVNKSYGSGRSGFTMSIQASDQLKMLDLSYVTYNPTMTPGASGVQGLDLRWGARDLNHFGTWELFNPYAAVQILGQIEDMENAPEAQKEQIRQCADVHALTNVFGGVKIYQIITRLCIDAGIPTWYLKKRIEPLIWPPFTIQTKKANSQALFNADMKKRLQTCKQAAESLYLEFFADEEGNIVLKCPNYALGVNKLIDNNMGIKELYGSVLEQIDVFAVSDIYNLDDSAKKTEEEEKKIKGENPEGDGKTDSDSGSETPEKQDTQLSEEQSGKNSEKLQQEQNSKDAISAAKTGNASDFNQSLKKSDASTKPKFQRFIIDKNTTLAQIASQTGKPLKTVYEQNKDKIAKIGGPENLHLLYQLEGDSIVVWEDDDQAPENSGASDKPKDAPKDNTITNPENDGNKKKTEQDYKHTLAQYYSDTLAAKTDALIPEIPQEYIISFSLTDSDKQVYNMYEINIDGDFGVFQSNTPITGIRRVFPDIKSMMRFGCRPHPKAISFPYMGNREMAHMLGYMMCAKSMAQRHSATMSMIEDSAIRVGNPIRFFAYDEHPDQPIVEQPSEGTMSSAYNIMSDTGATISQATMSLQGLKSVEGNDIVVPDNPELKINGGSSPDTTKKSETVATSETTQQNLPISPEADSTSNTSLFSNYYNGSSNNLGCLNFTQQSSFFPYNSTSTKSAWNVGNNLPGWTPVITGCFGGGTTQPNPINKNKESSTANTTNQTMTDEQKEESKKDANTQPDEAKPAFENIPGSDYVGMDAKTMAQQTNAHSIYYVEQISRSIGVERTSTMTLTLTCGRMMGAMSFVDLMLLLYKTYYNPALGFAPEIVRAKKLEKKYKESGAVQTITIETADTLLTICQRYFDKEVDLSPEENLQDLMDDTQEDEQKKAKVAAEAEKKKQEEQKNNGAADNDTSVGSNENVEKNTVPLTLAQKQVIELKEAIISLNVPLFGATLSMSFGMFNDILYNNAGKEITIPTTIILEPETQDKSDSGDGGEEDDGSGTDAVDNPSTYGMTQEKITEKYGENATVNTYTDEDGNNVMEVESEDGLKKGKYVRTQNDVGSYNEFTTTTSDGKTAHERYTQRSGQLNNGCITNKNHDYTCEITDNTGKTTYTHTLSTDNNGEGINIINNYDANGNKKTSFTAHIYNNATGTFDDSVKGEITNDGTFITEKYNKEWLSNLRTTNNNIASINQTYGTNMSQIGYDYLYAARGTLKMNNIIQYNQMRYLQEKM